VGLRHGFAIWQLLTYGFLHGGIAHIFFNMLGLYMFGSDIERLFGSRYFLAYYTTCLVSAAITQLVFTQIAGGPPSRPWAPPATLRIAARLRRVFPAAHGHPDFPADPHAGALLS